MRKKRDKKCDNNPTAELVNAHSDNGGQQKKMYTYDPHIDPKLDWCGKSEHTSFNVPTVSLHVHERIDPRRIIEELKKNAEIQNSQSQKQELLFETDIKPLRQAIEFYKHTENWSNRFVAGDSLLVMNSLLEKEAMAGNVQMVYFDPPYGIKYGSNFQPFINKRDVKDGKDEDLTTEPEMIKAFRDTWELGIHSYLTYIRDRLLLARELLQDSGSIFVQISDQNIHHIREICDEVFGAENFIALISFKKTLPLGSSGLAGICDYIIWYAKNRKLVKYRELFEHKTIGEGTGYTWVELQDGTRRKMTNEERRQPKLLPECSRPFFLSTLTSSGYTETCKYDFQFDGIVYKCGKKSWRTTKEGMEKLISLKRIMSPGNLPVYVQFHDDFPYQPLHNLWDDTHGATEMTYVVQTSNKVISRCLLMTTDPGDLVLDITCGSGTTAYVAETWGRRWITCDTSRVAITLAKQRLLTAQFDYFELAHPSEGVCSGFRYKTVPHITLKSIANNEPAPEETLYDQPYIDKKKIRITGQFTVEAVPAPTAIGLSHEVTPKNTVAPDVSIARSGETIRQSDWQDELLRTGVRGKAGTKIEFNRVESLSGTKFLQAEAETKNNPQRVLICFGPEHAPLEQRTVELAIGEAQLLKPAAKIILFCAFQFDEEAAKDIDETNENLIGFKLLKVQMNADLLTDDLRKKRSSNDSFWLIGQPDVEMTTIKNGKHKGKSQIEVRGFDYYNPKNGEIISGGKNDIAMWMLDTDYDGRSLYPSQVFFPMSGPKDGWSTLAKNLKAELDEEKIESFKGTVSLPFTPGKNVAVKIIDARGIESLKIVK